METTLCRDLVCGEFPDLEVAFIERVKALRRADALAPLIVLVPTNLLRRHLSHALADRSLPHLNVRFVTIDAWVRDLTTPHMLTHGLISMPKCADELLMARACSERDDHFYFDRLSDRPGLHRSLLGSIQDLKEAGADVANFETALHHLDALYPSARTKLESLLAVWRRYEELKQQHRFLDDADQHALAAQVIADESPLRSAAAFLVYGIYDFKRMQARLVLAAAEQLATTVYFPFQPNAAWEYARPSLEMLVKLGFTWTNLTRSTGMRNASLDRLCDRLFASRRLDEAQVDRSAGRSVAGVPPPRLERIPITPDAALDARVQARLPLQIVSVASETREAVELPRLVLELAREVDIHFSDIAVLLRSGAGAERVFREALDQAGLPVCSPNGIPLWEHRAGRALLLMIQLLQQDYTRRDVMELITFADLDFESLAGWADPPTALWDALSMRAGIVRGRDQWLRRLSSLQTRLSRAKQKAEIENAVHARTDSFVDPSVVASLIQAAARLFAQLGPIASSRTWGELIDRTAAAFSGLIRPSAERDRVAEIVLDLRKLDALGPPCDLGLLGRLIDQALREETSQNTADRAGTTLVPLMQARGVPFRAVIVPGMTERSFPQLPSVDPILLDHERRQLNDVFATLHDRPGQELCAGAPARPSPRRAARWLPPLLPLKGDRASEERLLFRLAVGAAGERLILTFPRIEAETGRERVPSYFLFRTIEAAGPLESKVGRISSADAAPPQVASPPPVSAIPAGRRRRKQPHAGQLVLPFLDLRLASAASEPAAQPAKERESQDERSGPGQQSAQTAALAQWPGIRHVSLAEFAPAPSRAVSLFEHDLGAALAEVRSAGQSSVLGACASLSPHFARGVVAESLRWGQRTFTRYDGRVEDPELLAVLRRHSPLLSAISPSRIEDYARCPFHFSMHNLLGLEAVEEPEQLARSDPAAKGTLVHEILAEFLRTMKKRGRLPLATNHAKYLLVIARRHMRDFEESGAAGPALTWNVEREQLLKFFEQFIAREVQRQIETGYRPEQFEMSFGRTDAPPGTSADPAKFDLGNGHVLQFRGVIDRVDISEDGKRLYVIDYKGRRLPNPGREGFGLGTVVQLPIYQLGAQTALLAHGPLEAGGGEYMSYQPDVESVSIPALDDKATEKLRDILRTIAEGIHAGLFMQFTGQDACRYCPYDRVCMGVQETISELKQGDPAAAEYLEMKGRFKLSSNEIST